MFLVLILCLALLNITQTTSITLVPKENCPEDGVLFPIPGDCSKFGVCHNGKEKIFSCPGRFHFDSLRKVCTLPEVAGCEKASSSARHAIIGASSSECPEINPKIVVLLPHESDCELYYICESGVKIERECPDGLHFNLKKKVCDFPNRAGCQIGNQDKALYRDPSHHSDCPAKDPPLPVIIPHESDCSKFYICSGGLGYEKTCMVGLHFNPKLRVCDYPGRAKCTSASMEMAAPEVTGVPSPFCPLINGEYPIFFPHPTECSKFYMCGNGIAYLFTCSAGLHFNPRKNVCDSPLRAGC